MRRPTTNTVVRRALTVPCVIAAVMIITVPAPATASSALRPCGTMDVRALRPGGYKTERLMVDRGLSCAKGRGTVRRYYTSTASCLGSGCFRLIDNLNCGGGQSSILGGVALLCTLRDDPSAVVIELRVRPEPPSSSLETDGRVRATRASVAQLAAVSWPTTVDLGAIGPEAHVTSFGVKHPGHFVYGPIPVSYDVTAWHVHWEHWGASSTLGLGRVQFCIIMSPCHTGPFTIRLFRRQFVSCPSGKSHFGYTRVRLDVSEEQGGRPFTDTILVGC
jgi:hypothetical protein